MTWFTSVRSGGDRCCEHGVDELPGRIGCAAGRVHEERVAAGHRRGGSPVSVGQLRRISGVDGDQLRRNSAGSVPIWADLRFLSEETIQECEEREREGRETESDSVFAGGVRLLALVLRQSITLRHTKERRQSLIVGVRSFEEELQDLMVERASKVAGVGIAFRSKREKSGVLSEKKLVTDETTTDVGERESRQHLIQNT
ncbi:hypothetical protein RHMOL_Rhmol04G0186800 [Rhododendron molle]|uniref:Uncharacterized protein n=1 Tax=Rhododendron molle TaxID=49168 RepID=A0ACC0P1X8_RHOML|nr:hypothetical protein RHMOL_Rhmol04G0186800 [Rhododendron molle]